MMTKCKSPFLTKFKVKNTNNIPKVIEVAPLCEHAQEYPQLEGLGKKQLKLFKALQTCDMNKVLEFDWVTIYNSLQTLEVLGLVTYPETIVSLDQLKEHSIQLLKERHCSCNLTR